MLLLDHQIKLNIRFSTSYETGKVNIEEMASVILRMIVDTEIFSIKMIRAIPMPTSIKEAYYKYCYGIFLNKLT